MLRLPDFPWDSLAPTKERASAFSDPSLGDAGAGIVDLSVGTPVDPTPQVVRDALAAASDAHGYPLTWGTPDLREAVSRWFAARRGVPDVDPSGSTASGAARACRTSRTGQPSGSGASSMP